MTNVKETVQPNLNFIPVEERPVQQGVKHLHDSRPVCKNVRAGGDPNVRIIPAKYPARG